MSKEGTTFQTAFLETKEYRRFTEFCDACQQFRYIGLCYGPPGVGKSFSAWHYARWNLLEIYFPERFYDAFRLPYIEGSIARIIAEQTATNPVPLEMEKCTSILYTPPVTNTPRRIELEIRALRLALSHLVDATRPKQPQDAVFYRPVADPTKLLIVDETDRLKTTALEQLRDIYDQRQVGLVLIGMPGLEKRLSRYPQLYSRVGFVHEFRPLNAEEVHVVLQRQWEQWEMMLQSENAAEMEAVAAIVRITRGNFRLLHRLLAQIERIVQINAIRTVTKEVVEVARQQLVIGAN